MEGFKHINGFKDYLISPTGKVYSLKSNKYLRPSIAKGYYHVRLCKSGNRYTKYIARLVAQAFISNPDNKPEINHRDGIKANNDVSNLEWVTHSENMFHAYSTGLKKPSPNVGVSKVPVKVYDYKTGEFKSIQPSQSDAARRYGLFVQNIHHVLAGRYHHTGGFTFKRI